MIRSGRNWRCVVSDNGIGMDEADRSTGLNIVDALVRSLKGRLIIRSGASGTCVCVILPDHSLPRGHRSELDAIAAAHVPMDSAQRSHPTNRMDNRFVFTAPTMAFNGGNNEIRPWFQNTSPAPPSRGWRRTLGRTILRPTAVAGSRTDCMPWNEPPTTDIASHIIRKAHDIF
jgi:hypothetical protein